MIEAFLASVAVVALAEIGDKTMLLAIVLAARLRAPWQILAGIFVATIANHALAALVGREVAGLLVDRGADLLRGVAVVETGAARPQAERQHVGRAHAGIDREEA